MQICWYIRMLIRYYYYLKINVRKKAHEQLRMDNPEKLAKLGTQDEDKQNKQHIQLSGWTTQTPSKPVWAQVLEG